MLKDEEKERLLSQVISTPEERQETSKLEAEGTAVFDITQDPYNHMIRLVFSR